MSAAGQPALVRGVLLPFAFAYVLSYLYRTVNAVIAPDLVAGFDLSPAQLGLLTSAYFLTFAAFQLPLGLLLDRFGPRRTDAALLVVAAGGAFLFAAAGSVSTLAVGRALIGLGVSGCLMSGIKANVLWFPAQRLPAMNGWMFFAGGIGMVAATVPVELALKVTDWRVMFLFLAGFTLVASVLIVRVVPEHAPLAGVEPLRVQLRGLAEVFRKRAFWDIALGSTTVQATSMAIQGLWAGPWLRDVAGLSRDAAAAHLLAMAVATMTGFLLWGNLAVWLARRGVSGFAALAAGMGGFLGVQLLLALGWSGAPALLWIAFGIFGTAGSVAYAILSHRFPSSQAGRVITALNALVFSSAFLLQWGMGAIIERWPAPGGRYHPDGFRAAFGAFLLVQALGYVWMLRAWRRTAWSSAAGRGVSS
jgi:predicted MFS family arabinose efflux permease